MFLVVCEHGCKDAHPFRAANILPGRVYSAITNANRATTAMQSAGERDTKFVRVENDL